MASSGTSSQSRSRRKTGPTAKRPPTKKRFGCEVPRVWTKPLRTLTRRTSLGFSVIEFAESILEIELLPWQKWLLIHMLELLPDNSLRFRTVIVLVARQNGKSTLSQVLALWFMYVYGVALVIGTAQDLDVAEEIWQGAVDLAEESEELAPLIERVVKVNGKKALEVDLDEDGRTDTRYKVKAANRRAGRGLSGDVILLDELREHQTWDAWGAITKTTMARAMALILALSNAGDATSVVLRHLRQICLQALVEAGEDDLASELLTGPDALSEYIAEGIEEAEEFANSGDDSIAIFEWSATPGCSIHNRDGWAQANPSLGYTITERNLAAAVRTDPEWVFRTECLCQWSDGSLTGPFPPGVWESLQDPGSQVADWRSVLWGVDVSVTSPTAHVGIAGLRTDGIRHVEVVASRPGVHWVAEWFRSRVVKYQGMRVAIQARGCPASPLIEELEAIEEKDPGTGRTYKVEVVPWGGSDLVLGTLGFYNAVVLPEVDEKGKPVPPERGLRHLEQAALNLAAATAEIKPMADGGWVWDRKKSATDIAPLVAVSAALWLLNQRQEVKPPPQVHAWPEELLQEA